MNLRSNRVIFRYICSKCGINNVEESSWSLYSIQDLAYLIKHQYFKKCMVCKTDTVGLADLKFMLSYDHTFEVMDGEDEDDEKIIVVDAAFSCNDCYLVWDKKIVYPGVIDLKSLEDKSLKEESCPGCASKNVNLFAFNEI